MSSLRSLVKSTILRGVAGATRRSPVLLPREATSDTILSAIAPYRIEHGVVTVQLLENSKGVLHIALRTYEGHFPSRTYWASEPLKYEGSCNVQFCMATGTISLSGKEIGRVPVPLPTRRFCLQLSHTDESGVQRSRLTGQYLALTRESIDEEYYRGDDYIDYEAQSAGEPQMVLELLRKFGAHGPLLEIGCATGGMIQALSANGFDSYGVDRSEWAIEQATERLGQGRAFVADVESECLPHSLWGDARFGVLLLWAVLEHFRSPFDVLARLAPSLRRGGLVVINTTNSDSLSHFLFGRDWEGYFDYSHYGVDRVSALTIAGELKQIGFECLEITTSQFWDTSADPTHATLRQLAALDARFRLLLSERNLGDLLHCVARKS